VSKHAPKISDELDRTIDGLFGSVKPLPPDRNRRIRSAPT